MKFLESVSSFWKKGVEFNGTASRSEYWWAQLFVFLCSVFILVFSQPENQDTMLFVFEDVITFIPCMALTVRRFNDIKLPIWIPIVLLSISELFFIGNFIISDPESAFNLFEYCGLLIIVFVMGTCLAPSAYINPVKRIKNEI